MDYKEWFDKLCETHEREIDKLCETHERKMKQAELRGYARGFQQGLESAVPKPCNGPKYDDWELGDFIMQIMQEFCEMVDEYKAFRRGDQGAIDRFAYECTDLITATVSAMEYAGYDIDARQRLQLKVNQSNAKRDGGRRFKS